MQEYYLGLDIGTDSVGWAVTDLQYKILKKNGKALWGTRLFPEANTAADRRANRIARRRIERREQRIALLRDIFAPAVAAVDPAFFQRLDESKFLEADKRPDGSGAPLGKYALFADGAYCDRDYHREFPTIYHLRRALLLEDRAFDVRLVYLAAHHILKKRGHFLFGDLALEDVTFESCLSELRECLREEYDQEFFLQDEESFSQALRDRSLGANRKKDALREAMGPDAKDRQLSTLLDFLAGKKGSAAALCGLELAEDVKFSFKDDFEAAEPQLIAALGDDMNLVYCAKRMYDWSALAEILNGERYLSCAKAKEYEKHKEDLQRLKGVLRDFPAEYRAMFRKSDVEHNYAAYSGHGSAQQRCNADDFLAYVKKVLGALREKMNAASRAEVEAILNEVEAGTFLPRQSSTANGRIPYQCHEKELETILERASRYLPFLREKDESGLTAQEKILAIFRFRIPYYVGPLNPKSKNAWLVRGEEKISPWNFDQVVDLDKSAENFITRMTAKCSYIGAPVLPRDSLLYTRFVALNMLNKLSVNGHPISVALKQEIYEKHLIPRGKTNFKALHQWLLSNGKLQKSDELGGVDTEFKLAMPGYAVFRNLLARGNSEDMVEEIIRHIVLFGKERKLLSHWLEREYGGRLSEEDRAYVLRQRERFSGWGNLSAQLLRDIRCPVEEGGEPLSIDEALWRTNCNLNELLSNQYGFASAIEQRRAQVLGREKPTLEEFLRDSYASPGIRRAIHQSMGILDEIQKLMGGAPKRVFVEVTRGEGAKERTQSRKKQLEALYKSCKKDAEKIYEDYAELYAHLQKQDDAALRGKKLYLYFTQMGRCMYSGRRIDLADLFAEGYDIDHIHPRSVVKDDSFDNLVLVRAELNRSKTNDYPIRDSIRETMRGHWTFLRKHGLISEEKYRRLTRATRFEDSELAGFIARQLVQTGQAAKIVAELLRQRYGDDRVVYVKAGNVSAFRQDQRITAEGEQKQAGACKGQKTQQDPLFVKCREVNDFHHAKDAYLNIVVGNTYHVKFTRNPLRFVQSRQTYSMNRVFDFDVVEKDGFAWKAGEDGSIAMVRRMMRKNNILLTRYAREETGALFDLQILPKGKGQALIKASDPRMSIAKFGGYNKVKGAYFALIEHEERKKRVRSLEVVTILDKALYEREPLRYCEEVLGLEAPKVLISKIKIDSLFCLDGFRMHLSGRTSGQLIYKNANPLVLDPEWAQYIKQAAKCVERYAGEKEDVRLTVFDAVDARRNCELYQILLAKLALQPYRVKYGTPAKTLAEHAEAFRRLAPLPQCKVLLQILNLFSTNANSADLKLLCGKAGIGILRTSKNLENFAGHSFRLIHPSITGVFEREIDLLGDEF